MADESSSSRQGTIFSRRSPLVKAATGEVVSAEELGGAEVPHAAVGRRDHYAQNEPHAISIAGAIVAESQPYEERDLACASPPSRSTRPQNCHGVIPADERKPYDVREAIARIVDGSELDEFKADIRRTLVTGFARIWATDRSRREHGSCFPNRRCKATATSSNCAASRGIPPFSSCRNIAGFMVGGKNTEAAASPANQCNGATQQSPDTSRHKHHTYDPSPLRPPGDPSRARAGQARLPKFTGHHRGGSFGAGNVWHVAARFSARASSG